MDNKDFFNEQDKQRDECKKHTSCVGCPNDGICLLSASSPVSIFNYAKQDTNWKLSLIKASMDKFYKNKELTDPYDIGLHNGMESVIALFEHRQAEHKYCKRQLSLWQRILERIFGE